MKTKLEAKNTKDLLIELIKTNFKIRYNNSILGFLWVLIKPFAMFTILFFVWTAFRGQSVENYQVKLLLGMILYTFVNEGVIFGMNGLLDKAHIILKVNFPREIAVMSSVAMAFINFCINMFIFFIFCLFNPINISILGIIWFIFVVGVFVLLIYALNLFLSILLIRLRDLQHIFELLFQLLFWATPIFYEIGTGIGQIGGRMGHVVSLNPLGWFINISRQALIEGKIGSLMIWDYEISSLWLVFALFLIGLIMLSLGKVFFKNEVKKVAEYF